MPFRNKEYAKRYMREYHLERQRFIREAKNKPCADCGIQYPYYVMQFDHVSGEKINNINWLQTRRSASKLQEEIDKCEVVCANCHAIRTYNRLPL